jgi:uncharacterized protein
VRVHLDEIKDKGIKLWYEVNPDQFPALAEITDRGEGDFRNPLTFDLNVRPAGKLVLVEGILQTRVGLTCSRCLAGFEFPLEARFFLTFTPQPTDMEASAGHDDIELESEEIGLIPFSGEEIDMKDALQEEVVMALPMQPLCKAGCKGLCTRCGADLNEGDCGCHHKIINPQFAALQGLKIIKK